MPIKRIGQDFIVNTTATSGQIDPSVTALADGSFVVTWSSIDEGDGSGPCIRGRLYNADGSAAGNDFIVNSTATGNQFTPAVTALTDGRFVVTWGSGDPGDGNNTCIRGRLYNADGTPDLAVNAGNDFVVNTTAAGEQAYPAVTALANGRFVVTWASDDPGDGSEACVRGRVFNADGSVTVNGGNDFIVNSTTTDDQLTPSVTALADGRFVVTWRSYDNGDGQGSCIRGRLYNADGVAAGNDFIVNTTATNEQEEPSVTALADGRFVVTWNSGDPGDGSGSCIRGRLYSADGAAAGNDFVVNTTASSNQFDPAVTALADGRFVVTWTSADIGDGSGTCIRAQVFDPTVFTGTAGADTWQGGNFSDYISGGEGDDTLSGGGDGDAIEGGAGNDTISGDEGADELDGGDGTDTASYASSRAAVTVSLATGTGAGGDAQDDELWEIENLLGSAFADTLIGDAGNNGLDGGAGDDVLNGGAGDDTLEGGAGNDTAVFAGTLAAHAINWSGGNITLNSAGGGFDTAHGIERFQFADGTVVQNDGNAFVDDLFYYGRNPDVWAAGVDAEAHYAAFGWKEGRDPNAFFSTHGYLSANSDVDAANVNPLEHYHLFGWKEGRDADASFDTELYLLFNPDVAAANVDPLEHFLAFGREEGRAAHAAVGRNLAGDFDRDFYLLSNPDIGFSGADPLAHFNMFGWHEGRDPNAYFDTDAYLAVYADVAAAGVNPLDHYHQFGWKEGRAPSGAFDSDDYLAAYADVKAAGVDPLEHFLKFGIYEGRSAFGDGVIA